MYVKDDTVGTSVGVLDFKQGRAALGRHLLRRSPIIAGNEDDLCFGAGIADGSYNSLNGVCPFVNVRNVVGLRERRLDKKEPKKGGERKGKERKSG